MAVTTGDLSMYLGVVVDEGRASLMLALAADLCSTIVSPLPDEARAVVLSCAARGYSNPQGVTYETTGPYSVQRPYPGLYLTRSERSALKRMAGVGGAFTINPLADDVLVGYGDPLDYPTVDYSEELAKDEGFA